MKRGLAVSGVLAEFSPVHQTCKLLQMNKTNDVMEITSISPSLTPRQVWIEEEDKLSAKDRGVGKEGLNNFTIIALSNGSISHPFTFPLTSPYLSYHPSSSFTHTLL